VNSSGILVSEGLFGSLLLFTRSISRSLLTLVHTSGLLVSVGLFFAPQ
jgi:hypothetical protein